MTEVIPVGELHHSRELYGERMTELREALDEAGFELQLDPLEDQAELLMEVEQARSEVAE